MISSLLFLVILLVSDQSWGQEADKFFQWLEEHKQEFIKCEPKSEKNHYRFCDNTLIDKSVLKSLFKLTPADLHTHILSQGIKIKIKCAKNTTGVFNNFCLNYENIKLDKYHGKFLPEENTILLQSNSTKGDLIHEFIHYLQFTNQNLVFGKRYKHERVEIQKSLVKIMDDAIDAAKKVKSQTEAIPLVRSVQNASSQMMKFSYWQDIIDERNIFQLYLKYGHEFGVADADLALAKKNMGFICLREKLPEGQCEIKE